MTDYISAVDDSGGIEPLVKWGGTFVPGDHPITGITFALLRSDQLEIFNDQWSNLRQEIGTYLGTATPPPIHLRLMYGRKLPPVYRQRPNPYVGTPFVKICEWIDKALGILQTMSLRPRTFTAFNLSMSREQAARSILTYFGEPALVAEMQYLKEESVQHRHGMAKRYLNKLASPLLPLFTNSVLFLDVMMQLLGNKTVSLHVDRFSDSHSLDALEVIDAVNRVSDLQHIRSIQITADGDDVPLAQAADLLGFINFRFDMAIAKHIQPDLALIDIVRKREPKKFITANIGHVVSRRYPRTESITRPIQYAVARKVIESVDGNFAQTHLISVLEMRERIWELMNLNESYPGVSILRDASVCAHLIRPINGEDPR